MPEVVGSAYVRIRAITADLAKDIRDGVEKGAADADLDRSGEDIGNRMVAGARKSMQKGMKEAAEDSTKDLHRTTDVHSHGQSLGGQFADGFSKGWKRALPGLQKEFTGGWKKVLTAALPLTFSFASLLIPIIAGAVNLIGQYIISLVSQLGFLVTASIGAGAAMGAAFGAVALGIAPIVIALKKATPELEQFLAFAKGIGEEWLETADDFQAELLPALRDVLSSTTNLIPAFQEFGVSVSRDVAEALRRVADEIFNNEERLGRLRLALGSSSEQTGTAASVVDNFAEALANVATVVTDLFIAAMPLADRFSESILRMTEGWRSWMEEVRTTGVLDQTLTTWYDRAVLLARGIGDFFVGVFNVLKIGADAAAPFFETFASFAERFRAFTETTEGENRIRDIFDKAIPVARELHALFRDIITAIIDPIFDSDTEGLVGFIRRLREEFLPVLEAGLANTIENLSGPVKELAAALGDLFLTMSESGSLALTLAILTAFLEILTLILNIPGMDKFLGLLLGVVSAVKLLGIVLAPVAAILSAFGATVSGIQLALGLLALPFASVQLALGILLRLVGGIIGPFLLLGYIIQRNFGTIRDFFVGVWHDMADAVLWAWEHAIEPVVGFLAGVGDAIISALSGAADFILDVLIAVFSDLWHTVQTAWGVITAVIATAWGVISGIFQAIASIVLTVLKPVFEDLWFAIQGAWNVITSVIVFAFQVIRGIFYLLAAAVATVLIAAFQSLGPIVEQIWDAIVVVISAAWTLIQVIWNALVWTIQNILVPIFVWLWEQVQIVWSGIVSAIQVAWAIIQPIWNAIKAFIETILVPAFQWLWDRLVEIWNGIYSTISFTWGLIQSIWSGLTTWVDSNIIAPFRTVRDALSDIWNSIWSTASTIWDSIINTIKTAINKAIDAINTIIDGINLVVGIIPGVDKLSHIPKLAMGGTVVGGGGTRAFAKGGIPSPLLYNVGRKGPFVTSGIRAIVGEGRRQFPEYVIPTDPAFRNRARALFLSLGSELGLFDGTVRRGGRPKSRGVPLLAPGGILGSVFDAIKDIGEDIIHGAASAAFLPINRAAKALINAVPIKFLRDSLHSVRKGIANWIGGKDVELQRVALPTTGEPLMNRVSGQIGGGVERWRGVALQALALAGQAASWVNDLLLQMQHESGGNPFAINLWDSNAARGTPSKGLMQTIDSTFNAYAGALRGRGIYDPLANIFAAIMYTVSRYGSLSRWRAGGFKGYAKGGIFDSATRILVGEAGREVLLPLTQPARARQLAEQSGLYNTLFSGRAAPAIVFEDGAIRVDVTGQIPGSAQVIGRQIGRGIEETLAGRTVRVAAHLAGGTT